MKKNGFVFVETIVILVMVILALTLFLSSYFLLTRKSKARDYYNLPNDKFLLFNISNIWSLGNEGEDAYFTNSSFVTDKSSCKNYIAKYGSSDECKKIFDDTNLERYAVIYNIDSSFKNNSISSIPGMTSDILEYLKTLKRKDGDIDLSYVVGVFKRLDSETGKYNKYYAALVFDVN